MKKIILLIAMLLCSWLFSETLILKTTANVYAEPNGNSPVVDVIREGVELQIQDKKAYYAEVEITDGSIHAGKVGYMFIDCIDVEKGVTIGQGVSLRSEPKKSDNTFVANVRSGASIKVKRILYKWYKVEAGWLFHTRVDVK